MPGRWVDYTADAAKKAERLNNLERIVERPGNGGEAFFSKEKIRNGERKGIKKCRRIVCRNRWRRKRYDNIFHGRI